MNNTGCKYEFKIAGFVSEHDPTIENSSVTLQKKENEVLKKKSSNSSASKTKRKNVG